jgi:hypothetical protein
MNKIKLLLLACSCSFGVMLFVAHPAHADAIRLTARLAIASGPINLTVSTSAAPTVNLQFASPINLTANNDSNPFEGSGCGCAACQKGFEQLQGQFPAIH